MARERRLLDIGGDIYNGQSNALKGSRHLRDVKRIVELIDRQQRE